MNRLCVNSQIFDITDAYKEGARAHRSGSLLHENPNPMGRTAYQHWKAGYDNEALYLHIVDGVDLTAAEGHGSRVFSAPTWPEAERFPKATKLRYALALMKASSMFEDAKIECIAKLQNTPHRLRTALANRGHALTVEFARLILRRIQLERGMAGQELDFGERRRVAELTDSRKQFVTAIGDLQETYFDSYVPVAMLAKRFGKSAAWPNSVARLLKRDRLDFLVVFTGVHCTLTPKGWAVVNQLQNSLKAGADLDTPNQDLAA